MKKVCLLLTAALLLGADKPKADDAKDIQGTWKVESVDVAGRTIKPAQFGIDEITLDGKTITLKDKGKTVQQWAYKLEPDKDPKAVDFVKKDKSTLPGIYSLKGDELRIGMPLVPKENKAPLKRPDSLKPDKDTPVMVLVARRAKGW